MADRAGAEISKLYEKHGEKRGISERERGEAAEWVASTKVVTTDTSLRVTAGVFEVTGSRSTGRKVGLDRFWRDVRTHSLHDPVAYKNREVGEYVLLNKVSLISLQTSCRWTDGCRYPSLPGIRDRASDCFSWHLDFHFGSILLAVVAL